MSFQWRTDDDGAWDGHEEVGLVRTHRLFRMALALALVIVGALLGWRVVAERAEHGQQRVEEDLLSSHRLLQDAVQRGDEELARSLLSGRDPIWTAGQLRRIQTGSLFSGAARPFGLIPQGEPKLIEVQLQPSLQEGVVSSEQEYTYVGDDGQQEVVTLRHSHLYRQGSQRWLLVPPADGDWGEQRVRKVGWILVTYPARDEDVVVPLAQAMDEGVARACRQLELGCSFDAGLQVDFTPDPEAVVLLQQARRMLTEERVRLPTPSLVGVPADATSLDALARGYAATVVGTFIARQITYRCCHRLAFHEAVILQQLDELGLRSWPLTDTDYRRFADDIMALGRLDDFWRENRLRRNPPTPEERKQVYAFIAFLGEAYGATSVEIQRGLAEAMGFWGWLRRIEPFDPATQQDDITVAWRAFLFRKANDSYAADTAPKLPEAKLYALCQRQRSSATLFQYDPAVRLWQEDWLVLGRFPALYPSPSGPGAIVFDRGFRSPLQVTRLWQAGRTYDLPRDYVPARGPQHDPQGRYLTVWLPGPAGGEVDGVKLVDLWQCSDGSCAATELPGVPYWSPDGLRFLLVSIADKGLLIGDRSLSLIDTGYAIDVGSAFWLDNARYGYVARNGTTAYVVGSNGGPAPWIDVHALSVLQQAVNDERPFEITRVLPLPRQNRAIFGVAVPGSPVEHLAFVPYPGSDTELKPLFAVEGLPDASAEHLVSPDGRWLSLSFFGRDVLGRRFLLFDLDSEAVILDVEGRGNNVVDQAHDWTADGKWLARAGSYAVELIAPRHGGPPYRHYIYRPEFRCDSVAWAED